MGLLEDLERERERVAREAAGVGQHVEGAGGRRADAEPDAPEAGHHRPPPLVEDAAEAGALVGRLPEGGERRPLHELVGRDEEVAVHGGQRGHELPRGDHVADAPAGHGEGLGEAVQHERVVGELEHGVLRPLVGEAVVDLVGDHPGAEAAEGGQPLRAQHGAGRVGRRVDEDALGPRGEAGRHRVRPELEGVRLLHRHVDRHAARELHELRIAGVVGVGEDHLVARVDQRAEEQQHRGRGARGHQDLVRRYRHAVAGVVVLGDRLAQRQDPEGVGVAGAPVLERLLGRLADDGRRVEVRLPELQVDDVDPLPLEGLGALEDLDGQERLDLLGAARDHAPRPPVGRPPRRRRAASTS